MKTSVTTTKSVYNLDDKLQILEGEEQLSFTLEAFVVCRDGQLWSDGQRITPTHQILDEMMQQVVKGANWDMYR